MCCRPPLRDYSKIEERYCQLVTHYERKSFTWPRGIATGPNNEVILAHYGNKRIVLFDKDLKLIRTFGQGSGYSKLNCPVGVAVYHNVIAVSEYYDHVVKKFSLQGIYLSQFGSHGGRDGQFNNPQGLCFNSKGLLYVVDHSNSRVQVFKENNIFVFKFGCKGRSPGRFQNPHYIAVDSSDKVYVTDCSTDGGVNVFSEDGYFIKKINCNKPFTICIAPDDYIIIDSNDVLSVFNPNHHFIANFGKSGTKKGQFSGIYGIAINKNGTIFVSESNRIQIIIA